MVDAAGVMARDALPALKQGGAVASSQRDEAGDHQQPDQEDRVQQGPGLPAQQQQHAGESEGQQQQQAVPVLEPQLPVALQHPAAAAAAEPAGALETAAPVPLGAIPLGTIGSLGGTLPVGAVPLGAIPLGPVGLPLGAGAAPDAAAGPKGHHSSQSLTFAWLGEPHVEGSRIYYGSFSFCDTRFDLGDHVYLIPEDAGAPLYLGRVTAAYEDDTQQGGDRLCIEVQWYERRANMPPHLQPGMHDREVVECMQQTDTNLVGCIERKARVIKARSYEEAVAQLTHQEAAGEWHFCRGVLEVESEVFRTYEEVAADPSLTFDQRNGMVVSLAAAASAAASCVSRPEPMHLLVPGAPLQPMALQLFQPAEPAGKRGGGKGGRRGGGGGGGGRRGGRQARAFTGNAHGGVPGEICYECGATSTPQWREGPMGPRTLCNACGMRYQRSQGKGVNRPRRAGDEAEWGERKAARTAKGRGGRGRGRGRRGGYDDDLSDDEDTDDLVLSDEDTD